MHTTGQQLYHGRFTLMAPIGRGGSGTVWEARDAQTGNLVAIKLLIADAGGLAAVEREAEAAVRVRHPNAVQVLLTFEDADCAGVVMERCVASAADRVAAHGPIAPEAAVRMINAVLAALTAAHAAGVVHRDIKPANILLRADGSAALSDWGIARALFGSGVTHTTSIALLGTLPYLAPELRQDPRAASPATDLYAVGITLAWLLTGKVPPDPFVPAGEAAIRAALPAGLADVVLRACAWEPAERYASAAEMAGGLAGGLAGAGLGAELREVRAVVRKATEVAGVARRSMGPMWVAVGVLGLAVSWLGWETRGELSGTGAAGAEGAGTKPEAAMPDCPDAVRDWAERVELGPRETVATSIHDVDLDGFPDALFTNQYDESVSIWWGTATGPGEVRLDLPIGRSRFPVHTGDIDGDGVQDLVASLQDDAAFAWVRGLGNRQFAPVVSDLQVPAPAEFALARWPGEDRDSILFTSRPDVDDRLLLRKFSNTGALLPSLTVTRFSGTFVGVWENGSDISVIQRTGSDLLEHAVDAAGRVLGVQTIATVPENTLWLQLYTSVASGRNVLAATKDAGLWRLNTDGSSPCVLAKKTPAEAAAAADMDGDGVDDMVRGLTCQYCTSNHIFLRGLR